MIKKKKTNAVEIAKKLYAVYRDGSIAKITIDKGVH